ncbi:dihydrofolate reductase family protein [soil metagenome]
MRKVVAGLFMSLDNVVASPGKWGSPYMNAEMQAVISAGTAQSDAILLGRRTYLEFAELWPKQSNDAPMAAFMNNMPKYIVSSTLNTLTWANARLLAGDLAAALTKLKQQPGKNILIPGSPRLVWSLLRDGLLDELSLMIAPIVVGSGMRLFDELTDPVHLKLVEAKTLSTGLLSVTYQPSFEGGA